MAKGTAKPSPLVHLQQQTMPTPTTAVPPVLTTPEPVASRTRRSAHHQHHHQHQHHHHHHHHHHNHPSSTNLGLLTPTCSSEPFTPVFTMQTRHRSSASAAATTASKGAKTQPAWSPGATSATLTPALTPETTPTLSRAHTRSMGLGSQQDVAASMMLADQVQWTLTGKRQRSGKDGMTQQLPSPPSSVSSSSSVSSVSSMVFDSLASLSPEMVRVTRHSTIVIPKSHPAKQPLKATEVIEISDTESDTLSVASSPSHRPSRLPRRASSVLSTKPFPNPPASVSPQRRTRSRSRSSNRHSSVSTNHVHFLSDTEPRPRPSREADRSRSRSRSRSTSRSRSQTRSQTRAQSRSQSRSRSRSRSRVSDMYAYDDNLDADAEDSMVSDSCPSSDAEDDDDEEEEEEEEKPEDRDEEEVPEVESDDEGMISSDLGSPPPKKRPRMSKNETDDEEWLTVSARERRYKRRSSRSPSAVGYESSEIDSSDGETTGGIRNEEYPCNAKPKATYPAKPFDKSLYHKEGQHKAHLDSIERDVWGWSLDREMVYLPSPELAKDHPEYPQSFRNILIDWLFEVSQEFKLHRETTHLAINYLDRYLTATKGVKKSNLQLLGVTALFIAAKLEEIYPPNVRDFSAVTDGLFTFHDIHVAELKILDAIKWKLVPPTLNFWVNFYLQNATRVSGVDCDHAIVQAVHDMTHFFGPKFMLDTYLRVMSLVDAATHSFKSLMFPYSLLAASAVAIVLEKPSQRDLVLKASGFSQSQTEECRAWLSTLLALPGVNVTVPRPASAKSHPTDWFNLQTHNTQLLPVLNPKKR